MGGVGGHMGLERAAPGGWGCLAVLGGLSCVTPPGCTHMGHGRVHTVRSCKHGGSTTGAQWSLARMRAGTRVFTRVLSRIQVCTHTRVRSHIHVCTYMYTCALGHIHLHTHLCSHSRFCTLTVPVHTPASRRALQGHACTLGPHTPTRRAHVCARAHTCTCTRAHTCTHMCTHTRAHTCTHTRAHASSHVDSPTHTCTGRMTHTRDHRAPPGPQAQCGQVPERRRGAWAPPASPRRGAGSPSPGWAPLPRSVGRGELSTGGGGQHRPSFPPPPAPGPSCSHVPKQP